MPQAIGPTSLDVPAWVQAVGSVVAILVAVYISARDGRAQRRRVEDAKDDIVAKEIAERARFFQMVSLQLHECLTVIEEIAFEESGYQTDDESRPTMKWRTWADLKARRFSMECVERLERLEALPLTVWPDIESGIVFGDAVRFWKPTFQDVLGTVSAPPSGVDDDDRAYFLGSMNEVTYLSDFFLVSFERFLAIRDHEIEQARTMGIDIRYGARDTPDQLARAAKDERRRLAERRDPKGAFMSEFEASKQLRQSIVPEKR